MIQNREFALTNREIWEIEAVSIIATSSMICLIVRVDRLIWLCRMEEQRPACRSPLLALRSDALVRAVSLHFFARAIRTLQKHGGLDNFLVRMDEAKLAPEAVKPKRKVYKALR